jgi:hypothetical protein
MVRKQGRPPKDDDVKKAAHINTRITEELKTKLDSAAAESRRTLSQEIAERLEQSFRQSAHAGDSRETRLLLDTIAKAMSEIEEVTGELWHANPFTFREVARAVAGIVAVFRPPGKCRVPVHFPVFRAMAPAHRKIMRETLLQDGVGKSVALQAEEQLTEIRLESAGRGDHRPWRSFSENSHREIDALAKLARAKKPKGKSK